jgi:hypothetical protein
MSVLRHMTHILLGHNKIQYFIIYPHPNVCRIKNVAKLLLHSVEAAISHRLRARPKHIFLPACSLARYECATGKYSSLFLPLKAFSVEANLSASFLFAFVKVTLLPLLSCRNSQVANHHQFFHPFNLFLLLN